MVAVLEIEDKNKNHAQSSWCRVDHARLKHGIRYPLSTASCGSASVQQVEHHDGEPDCDIPDFDGQLQGKVFCCGVIIIPF